MPHFAHRGYTLIELMIVVGVGGILATTFGSVMYFQVLTYMQRLDETDAHQSVRGAFNAIRHSAQGARYGFGQNPNASGSVGVGRCVQNSGWATQGMCTDADNGRFDRLRLVSIVNDQYFTGSSAYSSAGPCSSTSSTTDPNHINLATAPAFINASASVAYAIGGNCLDPNAGAATDLIKLGSAQSGTNGCNYAGNFIRLEDGLPNLSCPTGYAKGFAFGVANIRDYFVTQDTTNPNNYNLMLRTQPYSDLKQTSAQQVLVYNVASFKVAYLIDYTTPPDHRADNIAAPCTDPRTTADGGTCPNVDSAGNTLTTQQLYNRIVGIQVTLGVRTATQRRNLVGPTSANGYRTWTYMSQFSIRNNGT